MNLKEKTLSYRFNIIYVPGRKNVGPDAASRYPTREAEKMKLAGEPDDADIMENGCVSTEELRRSVFNGLRIHDEDESLECGFVC